MVGREASHSEQTMSAAVFVEQARGMARFLEDREFAHVGDREIARARIEQRYGVSGSILYALRYRPPKQVAAEVYARLCAAVEHVASQQVKALEHEVATARARRLTVRADVLHAAQSLLGEVQKELARLASPNDGEAA